MGGRKPLTFAAVLVVSAALLPAQIGTVIDVTDSRPLAAALDMLERVDGISINYEDPPYQNVADVVDVSTPEQRAAVSGYQLLVPRIGKVTAQVPLRAAGASAADAVYDVNLLLANYRLNNLPGEFRAEEANQMIYVVPTGTLGADQSMISVTSPMMARVTIPMANRTVSDTAEAVLDAASKATGFKIVLGNLPFFPTEVVTFGATGEPARDALARLFAQTGPRSLSYRLDFDPKPDKMRSFDYMINVQPTGNVHPMAPVGLGSIPSPGPPLIPPRPASTGGSPFFNANQ